MNNLRKLIDQKRYIDVSALAIHKKMTAEARYLFSLDKFVNEEKRDAFENLLLADAPYDLDCYFRFLDYRQPLKRNFYLDRRKYLKPILDAVTKMYFPKEGEEELDVLRVKLRTRAGKSEAFNRINFWVQGNFPDGESLTCVGGGTLRDNIYEKRIAFIDDYWDRHKEVFPDTPDKPVKTSKELTSVWLRKSEYADISTVTVGGSIEGHVQCTNLLVLDDLVASNEINSVKRLEEIYSSDILNAIMRRYISGKIILIGTPIPTLTGLAEPLDRFYDNRKIAGFNCAEFVVPSLNKDMRSNYAYREFMGKKGNYTWRFTTREFMRERKAAYESENDLEIATFETIYQMKPMTQGSKRFTQLKRYNDIKVSKYREINIFDTADKGIDAAVFGHGRVYDDEPNFIYIHDIFYDKRPMDTAENRGYLDDLVDFIIDNKIHFFKYEENLGGTLLGEKLVEMCDARGYDLEYDTFRQSKNKVQRILDNAMAVINIIRVRENPPSKSYAAADREIRDWSERSKHDDVADCFTKMVEEFNEEEKKVNQYSIGAFL